jgi:hypothetical protein
VFLPPLLHDIQKGHTTASRPRYVVAIDVFFYSDLRGGMLANGSNVDKVLQEEHQQGLGNPLGKVLSTGAHCALLATTRRGSTSPGEESCE